MLVKKESLRDSFIFETMLIIVAIGITYLLHSMTTHKMVVLNLFYLPIVLAGYYLGRTNAGVLALFSVLAATIAVTLDASGFPVYANPLAVGLALTIWGACLGLTAILLGTLCDERSRTVGELHAAYVGVVEVLSKYLQSADPNVKARATRIAELSQDVAIQMKLSQREIDDVRVAALLYDLGNVEITTRLLSKAVGTLESSPAASDQHTFSGMDLVHSLGSVLSGALPLLVNQDAAAREFLSAGEDIAAKEAPVGANIICAVRALDAFTHGLVGERPLGPGEAIEELRNDIAAGYDSNVLTALEHVLRQSDKIDADQAMATV